MDCSFTEGNEDSEGEEWIPRPTTWRNIAATPDVSAPIFLALKGMGCTVRAIRLRV